MGVLYEIHGDNVLIASTSDAATAPLVARERLREPDQAALGRHTCVLQIRLDGELVGEHIVALAAGPLSARH